METTIFQWATEQGVPFALLCFAVWYFWKRSDTLEGKLDDANAARLSEQQQMLSAAAASDKVMQSLSDAVGKLADEVRRGGS